MAIKKAVHAVCFCYQIRKFTIKWFWSYSHWKKFANFRKTEYIMEISLFKNPVLWQALLCIWVISNSDERKSEIGSFKIWCWAAIYMAEFEVTSSILKLDDFSYAFLKLHLLWSSLPIFKYTFTYLQQRPKQLYYIDLAYYFAAYLPYIIFHFLEVNLSVIFELWFIF